MSSFVAKSPSGNLQQEQLSKKQHVNLDSSVEKELLVAIKLIKDGLVSDAIKTLRTIIKKYPKYELPQLILADLLGFYSGKNHLKKDKKLVDKRKEMIVRWNFIHKDKDSYQEKIPAEMIFVGKYYKHIIFIDVVENRMYIFENKNYKLSLIQNHYVSIGKNGYIKTKEGDKKTPLGVYFINGVVTKKTINPKRFGNSDALSLNYPNPIDKINKRTGHGIWIHGTPDKSLFRQPLASNGCISLETSSMQSIVDKMKGETIPVIISNNISWIDKKEFAKERANFFSILLNWKRAWESLSFEKYIDFYDKSFLNKNYNFRSWSAHKKKVIERSKYVEVNLHKILILYDRFNKVLLTSFEQDFSSDTYKSRNYKYLYWKLNKFNLWRVISEVTSKNIPTT